MSASYWERKQWFSNLDLCVVGSGIVGLSCALAYRKARPEAKILVLERGALPSGASTKNAGFACFGSISELVSDLAHHEEAKVQALVRARWEGIAALRQTLGDQAIGYRRHGGYELFLSKERELFDQCRAQVGQVNALLEPIFQAPVFEQRSDPFGFAGTLDQLFYSRAEGQIDTGRMMQALLCAVAREQIMVLSGVTVHKLEDLGSQVALCVSQGVELASRRVAVATNGFSQSLLDEPVLPARAQALITTPIEGLALEGTFHLDRGFYYFRNIDQRVLLGGGRNLDIEGETTTTLGTTTQIQDELERLLREVILPGQAFTIDQRWSGIMGVGPKKTPILKAISANLACGVRMSGMGIALGSHTGQALARLLLED